MAAVLAKGTTVIENAAREPEVRDLAEFLNTMGARITGAGTSRIEVEGVEELHPARHTVIPDRVVAATFLAAAGLAGGEVMVEDARPDHMDMLLRKLAATGIESPRTPDGLRAVGTGPTGCRSVDVATLPYPGFATDYKPLLVTMLTVADGVAIVTENLFAGRFRYVEELRRMGADIRTEGHHAVVRGVDRLSGAPVRATDIRAGAALVLAGLVAEGETVVADAQHVDRGYEDLAASWPRSAPTSPGLTPGRCRIRSALHARHPLRRPVRSCSRPPGGGDRVALARLLSLVERGGDRGPGGGRAGLPRAGAAYTVGITGAPGAGKSTLTDRLISRGPATGPRRSRPGGRAGRRPVVAVLGRRHPRRPGPDAGPRHRRRGLHPLDGHPRPPGRPGPGRARRRRVLAAAGMPVVLVETVGVGQDRGRVAAAADTTVVVVNPGLG